MKNTLLIFSLLTGLLLISCTDKSDILTVVNTDGTCYREFSGEVSKEFLLAKKLKDNNPFPVDIDSTCVVMWKCDSGEWSNQFPVPLQVIDSLEKTLKDSTQIITFTALVRIHYPSVEAMDTLFNFRDSHNWKDVDIKHQLNRKFRWFYTYYEYSETYPKIQSDFVVPLENYFSKEESGFWFTGQPDLTQGMNGVLLSEYTGSLETKFNTWFSENLWNLEYTELLKHYAKLPGKPVSKDSLQRAQEDIFKKKVNDNSDFKMKDILNEYYKTIFFSRLWADEESPMSVFESNLDDKSYMKFFTNEFRSKLILPGKILQAENAVNEGDTLSWQMDAWHLVPGDYTISAKSAKMNLWAFILSGLLILVAVGSFVYKPRK